MVSAGMKVIKYILFIFNLIFYIAGLVLIVAGALVQTTFRDYFVFFGGQFNAAAILLIVIGVIVFTIGFFGCCGAYKEHYCMIMTFSVLLLIVLILEIAAAIAAKLLSNQLEDLVRKNMNNTIDLYYKPNVRQVWDKTQEKLGCCGSVNYTDWSKNEVFANTSSVPDSCCIKENPQCGVGVLLQDNPSTIIYPQGCADSMISLAKNKIVIIGVVALVLAFIQIVGIIIACCLAAAIRKDYTPM